MLDKLQEVTILYRLPGAAYAALGTGGARITVYQRGGPPSYPGARAVCVNEDGRLYILGWS